MEGGWADPSGTHDVQLMLRSSCSEKSQGSFGSWLTQAADMADISLSGHMMMGDRPNGHLRHPPDYAGKKMWLLNPATFQGSWPKLGEETSSCQWLNSWSSPGGTLRLGAWSKTGLKLEVISWFLKGKDMKFHKNTGPLSSSDFSHLPLYTAENGTFVFFVWYPQTCHILKTQLNQ